MNQVLKTRAFWQSYFTLEPPDGSEPELVAQLEGLRHDFAVQQETRSYEVKGRTHTFVRRSVVFAFACGERFSLQMEHVPDINGCQKNLYVVDERSGTRRQMGWWDLARWHPYCLRLEELDSLISYWQRRDPRWPAPELPLLLLFQFVGLADEATGERLRTRVAAALQQVVGPEPAVELLDDALQVKEDYRWEQDAELGWVFTSEDYACYSLRNRPHAESSEGRFPFAEFRELMTDVSSGCEARPG